MVSALSQRITHVRAEELSDIGTYGAPDVIRHIMLFGATPEAAAHSPMVEFMGAGFRQSIDMLAVELGFRLDDQVATRHEVAVATAPIDSPMGPIEPGHRRHRHSLRERHPLCACRRAGHQDLPRSSAHRRPGRPAPHVGSRPNDTTRTGSGNPLSCRRPAGSNE